MQLSITQGWLLGGMLLPQAFVQPLPFCQVVHPGWSTNAFLNQQTYLLLQRCYSQVSSNWEAFLNQQHPHISIFP